MRIIHLLPTLLQQRLRRAVPAADNHGIHSLCHEGKLGWMLAIPLCARSLR